MKAGILKELLENVPDDYDINFWDTHDSIIDPEVIVIHDSFEHKEKKFGKVIIGCGLDTYKDWFLKMYQKPYEVFTPEQLESVKPSIKIKNSSAYGNSTLLDEKAFTIGAGGIFRDKE